MYDSLSPIPIFSHNTSTEFRKDSIQDKKQSLSSVENLTNELYRLQYVKDETDDG